jgi:hypothetical protein
MNIFYKNLVGSLMKTTNIWYETLPGLTPRRCGVPKRICLDRRVPGSLFSVLKIP